MELEAWDYGVEARTRFLSLLVLMGVLSTFRLFSTHRDLIPSDFRLIADLEFDPGYGQFFLRNLAHVKAN